MLFRQAPQALDTVTRAFRLSEGEAGLVASAGPGLGLLAAGVARVSFQVIASNREHVLASTSPADLIEDEDEDDGYFAAPDDPAPPGTGTDFAAEPPTGLTSFDDPEGDLL